MEIPCVGTGQDADIQSGVEWPNPRFVDNSDGTVTDMLTGLIWLKDASCGELAGTDVDGRSDWTTALTASSALADGTCDLSDGSQAGVWRLPSVKEMQSLIDFEYAIPALSDASGTAPWSDGNAFSGVEDYFYWSSSSAHTNVPDVAWTLDLYDGFVGGKDKTISGVVYVWPVRGGL